MYWFLCYRDLGHKRSLAIVTFGHICIGSYCVFFCIAETYCLIEINVVEIATFQTIFSIAI